MYLKINNKKIKIIELVSFKERFKSLKFILNKIDYGILISKKRTINTYFFCQRVDICLTDEDNIIKYLYDYYPSEKLKIKKNRYNIYYLPLDSVKYLKVGDKLKITKK